MFHAHTIPSLTLTKPYLTRTPHPAKVIPLHSFGNKIPVAGSFDGESMTGSIPNGAAEHCAVEEEAASLSLVCRNMAARRRVADEKYNSVAGGAGDGLV
jgi:hypothetical protein